MGGRVMRKYLLATISSLVLMGSASAADLVPDFRGPSYHNWAGFYLGVHVGSGWGTNNWDERFDTSFSTSYPMSGVLGGIHGGWNYQAGPIVVGAEANLAFSNVRGSGDVNNEGFETGSSTNLITTTKYMATFVGRGGIANDKWLYYLVAGMAMLSQDHEAELNGVRQTVRSSGSGYVLGFGAEYAVWQNLSVKLEYNYIGLRKRDLSFAAVEPEPVTLDEQMHVVKLGLSYHFGEYGVAVRK